MPGQLHGRIVQRDLVLVQPKRQGQTTLVPRHLRLAASLVEIDDQLRALNTGQVRKGAVCLRVTLDMKLPHLAMHAVVQAVRGQALPRRLELVHLPLRLYARQQGAPFLRQRQALANLRHGLEVQSVSVQSARCQVVA